MGVLLALKKNILVGQYLVFYMIDNLFIYQARERSLDSFSLVNKQVVGSMYLRNDVGISLSEWILKRQEARRRSWHALLPGCYVSLASLLRLPSSFLVTVKGNSRSWNILTLWIEIVNKSQKKNFPVDENIKTNEIQHENYVLKSFSYTNAWVTKEQHSICYHPPPQKNIYIYVLEPSFVWLWKFSLH